MTAAPTFVVFFALVAIAQSAQLIRDCKWQKISGKNTPKDTRKTIADATPEECKQACRDEKAFICRSFDYELTLKTCFLGSGTRDTHNLTASDLFDYYEYSCRNCAWKESVDQYLHELDEREILETFRGQRIRECKDRCFQLTGCKSFNYDGFDGTCDMLSVNTEDTGLENSKITGSKSYFELECVKARVPKECTDVKKEADCKGMLYLNNWNCVENASYPCNKCGHCGMTEDLRVDGCFDKTVQCNKVTEHSCKSSHAKEFCPLSCGVCQAG